MNPGEKEDDIILAAIRIIVFVNFTYFHEMLLHRIRQFSLAALFFSGSIPIFARQGPFISDPSQKMVRCHTGAVVSAHPLASRVGLQVLKSGGNAIDAAIATQLALAVVYPGAGNIGGGGFMVAHLANGKNLTIDFREKAPETASRNMYLDGKENVIPGKSEDGHLAAGVPGTIAGIFTYYPYAKLPFKKLIQPAIDLAEN